LSSGDYPFVQKQANGTLMIHPEGSKAVIVAWKNTTSSSVTVDLIGNLSLVGDILLSFAPSNPYGQSPSDDGITYFVSTIASLNSTSTILQQGSLDENNITAAPSSTNLALNNQTLAPGAMIYVAVYGNSNYYWDHTQLDLQITKTPTIASGLIDTGSIAFTDLDLTDRPTATEATKSVVALKADGAALTLTTAQQQAIESALTIAPADGNNNNNGIINWNYSIAEGSLDFLADGEKVTAPVTSVTFSTVVIEGASLLPVMLTVTS